MARAVVMTDKQADLLSRAKKILGLVNDLDAADKQALFAIVYQFVEAEYREKMHGESKAMAEKALAEQGQMLNFGTTRTQ